jgi:hypothetical protein
VATDFGAVEPHAATGARQLGDCDDHDRSAGPENTDAGSQRSTPPPKPVIADSIAVPKAAATSSAVSDADGNAIATAAIMAMVPSGPRISVSVARRASCACRKDHNRGRVRWAPVG